MTETGVVENTSFRQRLRNFFSPRSAEVSVEPSPAESFSNFLSRLKGSSDELASRLEERLRDRIKELHGKEWPKDVSEIEVYTKGWEVGDLSRDKIGQAETTDPKKAFELLGETQDSFEARFSKDSRYTNQGFVFAVKSGFGGVTDGHGKAETRVASLKNPDEKNSGVNVLIKVSRPGQTGDVYGHNGALLGVKIAVPPETAKEWITTQPAEQK